MDARALGAPEGGVMGGGAPSALHHRKEKEASVSSLFKSLIT